MEGLTKPIDYLDKCKYCREEIIGGGTEIHRQGFLWWRHDVEYMRRSYYSYVCCLAKETDSSDSPCTVYHQRNCPLAQETKEG